MALQRAEVLDSAYASDRAFMVERHLKARPADREALQLGVEWIYHAHASGQTLRTAAEDLRLAHAYADAYTKAGGPQSALVAHWVEFLDRDKR